MGDFPIPPKLSAAQRLWLEFFRDTEEFDRTLPGKWSFYEKETWLVAYEHRHASTEFALKKRAVMRERAEELRITQEEMARAGQWAGRWSHTEITRLLSSQESPLPPAAHLRRTSKGGSSSSAVAPEAFPCDPPLAIELRSGRRHARRGRAG